MWGIDAAYPAFGDVAVLLHGFAIRALPVAFA
jgi:hypothetical protein